MYTKKIVSIIMATYNREAYISESLRSIQNQTYVNFECLIIDDGGDDNTAEVVAPFLEQDPRFQFLKRSDSYKKGLPGCRNYGIDLAKGNYIIFFDDDDIVHPQNLELCVLEISRNNVSFCRFVREVFRGDFKFNFDYSKTYNSFYIDKIDIEKILKNELPINSCAVMWKKECFDNNRFVEHLMYAEEWELYSRIISTGFRGISIEKCLFFGRKHAKSNTGEFYSNSPIRRASYAEAILLVFDNLVEHELLTKKILHYFIQLSLNFKEYKLFQRLLIRTPLSKFKKLRWYFFYFSLPLRLFAYGKWKIMKKTYF
ncbi:glycosyltransferase family 2 protein [Flavobacterium sp. ARAG 55.4]|uniref:glycosyltransferase family 2 protein n=1 Tax=Flavobacterium sp. ARAG 55.4 TaxID=3451357 RepID=UPI003F44567B